MKPYVILIWKFTKNINTWALSIHRRFQRHCYKPIAMIVVLTKKKRNTYDNKIVTFVTCFDKRRRSLEKSAVSAAERADLKIDNGFAYGETTPGKLKYLIKTLFKCGDLDIRKIEDETVVFCDNGEIKKMIYKTEIPA